jgi:1,4-alpha-glucan branching enzyme
MEYPAKLRKGIEEFLSEERFHYFFIDSHLLRGGKAIGMYADRFKGLKELWKQFKKGYPWDEVTDFTGNPFRAYLINSSGEDKGPIAIYTRDADTSLQVWSGEHGYPGDGWYLDFHKKHFPGGLRYWRVTSNQCDLADKELYEVDRIKERYEENATHFVELIRNRNKNLKHEDGNPPIVVSPYDTELFGHWWFEGLYWLDSVIRQIDKDPQIHMITCGDHYKAHQPTQVIRIPEGSWGEGGYHFIWLNEKTDWTWRHIYPSEERMKELASRNRENGDPATVEILKKAATQLLLMQSSDWQFLITTGGASDYAEARFLEHYDSFNMLCDFVEKTTSGECLDPTEIAYLEMCSQRDSVFPDLELAWFAEVDFPPKES